MSKSLAVEIAMGSQMEVLTVNEALIKCAIAQDGDIDSPHSNLVRKILLEPHFLLSNLGIFPVLVVWY